MQSVIPVHAGMTGACRNDEIKVSAYPTGHMEITIKQTNSLNLVDKTNWQQLDINGNPFLNYDFLNGLERFKCLEGHGWEPCHLLVMAEDKLLGAMPLYIRDNSHGEFVFDWVWADAFEKAGGNYYPKLVSAIPFTPVCGPRILINRSMGKDREIKALIIKTVTELAEQSRLSSFHCLFTENDDQEALTNSGLLLRKTCQFHWHNRNYLDFDDFLQGLTSKRRKQIKRERARIKEENIDIVRLRGADITEEHWAIFYEFYCNTFYRRWGSPRLTLDFFHHLSTALPENTLLILAKQGKEYVAGAFAMLSDTTIYGRHWGCDRYLANLHFELCYYQTIDHCLENGLSSVDAGVQGEHKLNRGFEPFLAKSGHWISHTGFRNAIDDYLQRESAQMNAYVETLKVHLPFREIGCTYPIEEISN